MQTINNVSFHNEDMKMFLEDPISFLMKLRRAHKSIVNLQFGIGEYTLVFEPNFIEKIMENKNTGRTSFSTMFDPVAKGSIILNEGEQWRRQRKMLLPSFTPERFRTYEQAILDIAERHMDEWECKCMNSIEVDAKATITTYCMEVLTLFLYGKIESTGKLSVINENWNIALECFSEIMTTGEDKDVELNDIHVRLEDASKAIERAMYIIIDEKIKSGTDTGDFLSYLVHYKDQDGNRISKGQIKSELMGLFMAGFETVASALTWFMYDIACNEEIQCKLKNELLRSEQQSFSNTGYLKLCFSETLRLHPPLLFIDRKLHEDIFLDGCILTRGTEVLMSPYIVHIDPRYWDNPLKYDPSRFEDYDPSLEPYAYFPYGGGQMRCMGEQFAYLQRNILMTSIFKRFKFTLAPYYKVTDDNKLALKPNNLYLSLQRVGSNADEQ